MTAVHLLMIRCWKYIKPLLDKIEDAKNSTETPSETSYSIAKKLSALI